MATLTFVGNLGADPKQRTTNSGNTEVRMSIAHESGRMNNGVWESHGTMWISVYAYNNLAQNILANYRKGDRVLVTGRFDHEEYTTKNGDVAVDYKVFADSVALIPRANQQTAQPVAQPMGQPMVAQAAQPAMAQAMPISSYANNPWAVPTAGDPLTGGIEF